MTGCSPVIWLIVRSQWVLIPLRNLGEIQFCDLHRFYFIIHFTSLRSCVITAQIFQLATAIYIFIFYFN